MYFNFGMNLIDGGDEPTPVKQSPAPTPKPASFASFKNNDYLDYRTGERQSRVVDEQTKLAGMRNADIQAKAQKAAEEAANRAKIFDELAADKARAKQAQQEAATALADALEAQRIALAQKAAAERAAAEAIAEAERKAAEEEERRRREQFKYNNDDYAPDNTTSSYSPAPIPLTPSTIASQPSNISPVTQTPPPPPVKTAPIDTILFDEEAVPIQIMSDLIFENIGGQELINVARNDTVNGQQIIYQPIKNLTSIQQQYNPNNILAIQSTSDKYFQNFAIKFESKVPTEGSGPSGQHVYIDPKNGSLIIEAVNIQQDEQIEVEITTGGTIYEAEL